MTIRAAARSSAMSRWAASLSTCVLLAASSGARAEDARLAGVWLIEKPVAAVKTSDGKAPPLLPEAKERYEQNLADFKAGDLTAFDSAQWCSSPGIPRLMFMPYPFQLIVRPRFVTFFYEWDHWARMVDMQARLEPIFPSSMGQASGRWEGDTLVVETTGRIDTTVLDSSGLPHSGDLKVIERLRAVGADRLEDRIRLEDPRTFSNPWETLVTYKRQPQGTYIKEDTCLDRIKHEPAVKTR